MSIHYAADRHPIVGKAIQDAGDIVHGWLDSRDQRCGRWRAVSHTPQKRPVKARRWLTGRERQG
jgi:hypothetical protein